MSNNCPPLTLPIQIQTSCAPPSNSDCNCNNNTSNCVIDSAVSIQGSYQNTCSSEIKDYASIVVAYLSNIRTDCDPDTVVTLNPVCISWCDFLLLFYRANSSFSINPVNSGACAISFNNQTFENTTSKNMRLNLSSLVTQAWASKCETTVDNIPAKTNILLNKDTLNVRTLLNSSSAITLTLDQAFETLLSTGEIAPADSTSVATIRFIIQYKYCFAPLNTCVLINFVYQTCVPCYKNLSYCDNWCPPYSKDNKCRACGDLPTIDGSIANYLNKQFSSQFDADSSIDGASVTDSTEDVEIKNTKDIDEKTFITMESSRW